jgi:hypothetical protein
MKTVRTVVWIAAVSAAVSQAKKFARDNPDQAAQSVDKVEAFVRGKVRPEHAAKVAKGGDALRSGLGLSTGSSGAAGSGTAAGSGGSAGAGTAGGAAGSGSPGTAATSPVPSAGTPSTTAPSSAPGGSGTGSDPSDGSAPDGPPRPFDPSI